MGQVRQHLAERNYQSPSSAIAAVRAELVGTNRATALGVEAHSPAPVLALCRALVEAGHDPATPLHAYRNNTLALKVRSIGEAACLEVNGEGTGFRPTTKPGRASPTCQNLEAASGPLVTRLGCCGGHGPDLSQTYRMASANKDNPELRRCGGKAHGAHRRNDWPERRYPWPMSFSNTISTRLPKPISI